ncbi:MAG: sugar phosphate isomerase/epimerase [Rhodothermales bacterium]|jgi:sugar phosphate isomerase/epimerase
MLYLRSICDKNNITVRSFVKLSISMKSIQEPIADLVSIAKSEGIPAVQIACGDRAAISLKASKKKKADLKASLASAGITISSLSCDIAYPGLDGILEFKSQLSDHLEIAEELDAKSITILGSTWHGWDRRANYIDHISNAMIEQLEADSGSAKLLMQNHRGACNSFDCIEFAQYVTHPRFGIVFSTANSHMVQDGNLGGVLQANARWLWGVSTSDVNEDGKGVAPGDGKVDLKTTVKYQKSQRFRGWYTWDRSIYSAEDGAAKFKAAIGAK